MKRRRSRSSAPKRGSDQSHGGPTWDDIVLLDIPKPRECRRKALDLMQGSHIRFDARVRTTQLCDTHSGCRGDHGGDSSQAGDESRRPSGHERQDCRCGGRAGPPHQSVGDRDRGQQPFGCDGATRHAGDRISARQSRGAGGGARYGAIPGVSGDGIGRQRRRCLGHAFGWTRRHDGAIGELQFGGGDSSHPTDRARTTCGDHPAHAGGRGGDCRTVENRQRLLCARLGDGRRWSRAIVPRQKTADSAPAYCDAEYGVGGYYVGVPVVLGAGGVERIIQLELNSEEKAAFQRSVDAVKSLVETMAKLVA